MFENKVNVVRQKSMFENKSQISSHYFSKKKKPGESLYSFSSRKRHTFTINAFHSRAIKRHATMNLWCPDKKKKDSNSNEETKRNKFEDFYSLISMAVGNVFELEV